MLQAATAVVVALSFVAPATGAVALPEWPDTEPIRALAAPAARDCNAAEAFLAAEEVYRRTELPKPADQRAPLRAQDAALKLVLQGLECRRCEFAYSADLALPPTDQPIPMAALYWAASLSLVGQGRALQAQGRPAEAERAHAQAARLGVALLDDVGMTYVQQLIGLRILTDAAEGLGDLALAQGAPERAAACARFAAQSRAYREALGRFLREELSYEALLTDAAAEGDRVRRVASLFASTDNRALQVEILLYVGLARPLLEEPRARAEVEAALLRAAQHPDRRLRKLAAWCRALRPAEARSLIRLLLRWPLL